MTQVLNREGKPHRRPDLLMSPEERFWSKVDKRGPDECWNWIGTKRTDGIYGSMYLEGRTVYVHRFSYELHVGPIPRGLVIDHLCRNGSCVNPAHLEAVTQAENMRRSNLPSARIRRTGYCKHGHRRADQNLYISPTGKTACRICVRERDRRRRASKAGDPR